MWHREGEEAQDTRWVPNSSRSRIQTPGSRLQVQGAFQHLKPLRKPPASPTHLAQPGLSGLQVRDLESKAQIPHVLSGQLWTVAALRPPGWGEEQACKSAALPCPSWGDSYPIGLCGIAVRGFPHHFLGCECQGFSLQGRCALLRRVEVPAQWSV